jgi:hypothetical protein
MVVGTSVSLVAGFIYQLVTPFYGFEACWAFTCVLSSFIRIALCMLGVMLGLYVRARATRNIQ